jgi:ribonuclease HI
MLNAPLTHFLLFTEVRLKWIDDEEVGSWRFQLQALAGDDHFSGTGAEYVTSRDRIELLAVLRGLESLDQPSEVTLLTSSKYVRRGFRQGLSQWQRNDWQWERFGRRVPVKNHDLWRRVANALEYHKVHCRLWRIDQPGTQPSGVDHSGRESRQSNIPRPHFRRTIRPAQESPVEELQLAAG